MFARILFLYCELVTAVPKLTGKKWVCSYVAAVGVRR